MMFLPVIILALIQGVTEFLPISSSGHLVLAHYVLEDGKTLSDLDQKRLDIAVHIGTLFAVLLYFRQDFIALITGGIHMILGRFKTVEAHKTSLILTASIPVIIMGFFLFQLDMSLFDSIEMMAWATLFFGVVLYIADGVPESETRVEDFRFKHALFYGMAQCLALIPGVSRSGITMTAGRFLGHSRIEAARMALLMGMVTITAAGTLAGIDVFHDHNVTQTFILMMGLGMVLSFLSAYIAIWVMMRWFAQSGTMTPFVIYRVILGLALLILIYSGVI